MTGALRLSSRRVTGRLAPVAAGHSIVSGVRLAVDRLGSHRLVTTNLVLGETWTLLRLRRTSHARALALVDAVRASPRVEVAGVSEPDEARAWAWLRDHDERVYSFVDATSFVIMQRRRLHEALAFNGDFAAAGFAEVRP